MSFWHPDPICDDAGSCIIQCDNATGGFVSFKKRCTTHQALIDGGMSDADLFTAIQLDSMHLAVALETLGKTYPDVAGSISFRPDRSLELIANGVVGPRLAQMKADIVAAISTHGVVNRLLAGKKPTPKISVISSLVVAGP